MSERTSRSSLSIASSSTEFGESNVANSAICQEIRTESLSSHIQRFESGHEHLSWTRLMEWFVEAVIGVELFRNEHPSAPPLTSENIRIDSSSTIVIAFPWSPDEPSISGSLSSDISTLCVLFKWMILMETIENDATLGRDLSFLQSRCLRASLLSLQTKHQLRANPTLIEETNETESLSNEMQTDITLLPFDSNLSISATNVSSLTSSTSISTPTSLPSDHWSSDSHFLTSDQLIFGSDFIAHHSRQILSAVYLHLARYRPTAFPWDFRQSYTSESEEDALHQPPPRFIDHNETFDISLFDETDDVKVVASLRRCHAVLEATQATKCIVDIDTFRTSLVSGLRSSNLVVQMECHNLFFEIAILLQTVDDPRDSQFLSFQRAFRDGIYFEMMAILHLWMRWFPFRARSGQGQMMVEKDFDFDGFLAADLRDRQLFDEACDFVLRIIMSDATVMSLRWKMDFLLSFEKRHQMMLRISSDPNPSSKQGRSTRFLSQLAIPLGSYLSVYRGCDFPSALTELISFDLDSFPHQLPCIVSPAFFLNHTSIAPNHQHSFIPMDLMFERYLRSNPNAFFMQWPRISECSPRKFLHTSYVGLHSLLLRCPTLHFDQFRIRHLMNMLFPVPGQDTTRSDILTLFASFPPSRLFDTLLTSQNIIRTASDIWVGFLAVFSEFCELTAPFGACSSLAKVFNLLYLFDSNRTRHEILWLNKAGQTVVSLHWLSIPAHFDSPLLCHLPSLAGAQRGILQTLSSGAGILSLVTPNRAKPDWNNIRTVMAAHQSRTDGFSILSHCVRSLTSEAFNSIKIEPSIVGSRLPAFVSVAFECFHRLVSVSSDDYRIAILRRRYWTELRKQRDEVVSK
ncbi:hypothetical protein BLNAU_9398 [Blattamonas nauphoetae]|uniref:Uncharacterized protein n=1 Tax=Blattamonas nauphoetae TaxID=2049346 RepID=A0ABQ9XW49_9EUKA|nr:hypothetical protein BLNAU_9398 [Blattamonas nauphoetae]